ncbi:MAG: hypothetical protein MUQ32_18490 [Chloroflexi bacterium]|nr:hypothetical protein [Chloroflexota bacterium]
MPETEEPRLRRMVPRARAFGLGFVLGLVVTVPAILFALLSPVGEAVLRILTPGSLLLQPLTDVMATWPGLLNVALVAVANGLIFGLAATALVSVVSAVRR